MYISNPHRTMYCLIFNYMKKKKNEWKEHSGIRLVQNNTDTPMLDTFCNICEIPNLRYLWFFSNVNSELFLKTVS